MCCLHLIELSADPWLSFGAALTAILFLETALARSLPSLLDLCLHLTASLVHQQALLSIVEATTLSTLANWALRQILFVSFQLCQRTPTADRA